MNICHANEKSSTELTIQCCHHTTGRRQNHFIQLSLDDPSETQKEEFTFEIEQMKMLGSHKNVVSMVGCCTLEEKMFLVIEYVPCGDLLTWLRRRRKKVRKSLQRVLVFWKCRPPFFYDYIASSPIMYWDYCRFTSAKMPILYPIKSLLLKL